MTAPGAFAGTGSAWPWATTGTEVTTVRSKALPPLNWPVMVKV